MNGTTTRRFKMWHAGVVLAALGALAIVVGALQTTKSAITECPSGTVLVAKFEYQGGSYRFEKGTQGVVTIGSSADADGGPWSSTRPIAAVVVKGGPNSVITSYDPPVTSGTFSNAGLLVGSGNVPDISNVQFCASTTPPPSTTTPPTTVPETTSPPTTAPETTAPETTAPATDPATTTTTSTTTTTTTTTAATTAPPTSAAIVPPPPPTEPATTTTSTTTTSTTTTSTTTTSTTTTTTSVPVAQLPPSTSTTVVSNAERPLPNTGAPSALLVAIGAILTVTGITLTVVDRARRRPTH